MDWVIWAVVAALISFVKIIIAMFVPTNIEYVFRLMLYYDSIYF